MEHTQSVKHAITADVSTNAGDLNQNVRSETSREFLKENLHQDNKGGAKEGSNRSEINESRVQDFSHQLPSMFHNVQDKNSLESFTNSQTNDSNETKEMSSVAVQQANIKSVADPVLQVIDDHSSDFKKETFFIAGKTKVINDISTTFPRMSESPQRTVTPTISSDDDDVTKSGDVPVDTSSHKVLPSSTESSAISADKILVDVPEDIKVPVLGTQDSQGDGCLKKDSRQPILEVLSGMLQSPIPDMATDIDRELVAEEIRDSANNSVTACHPSTTDETCILQHDAGSIGCTNETNEITSDGVNKYDINCGVSCDMDASIPDSSYEATLRNKPELNYNPTPEEQTDPPNFCEKSLHDMHGIKGETEDGGLQSVKTSTELQSPALKVNDNLAIT